MTKTLIAKTHPAEYLIHKYWARKPHNILSYYIENYFNSGDTVLDPFSGSGVFLAEAKKNKLNVIGFDINPIAFLLTDVTTNPPNIDSFIYEAEKIINYAKDKYKHLYEIEPDEDIRYLVHEIRTKCKKCSKIESRSNSKKTGNKYYCIKCNEKISFNFENLFDTKITKIISKNNNEYTNKSLINIQTQFSKKIKAYGDFNKNLLTNRRILSFPNMKLSDLFTPRAYTLLSDLFEKVHKIKNIRNRRALLLFLTSSVAQCSRLIPYRNNLSTGGPAWTVPGFWLAPTHLETNPIIHLEARYKKFLKGISALNENYKNCKVNTTKISLTPAQEGMKKIKDRTLDGIFFDPPYGDNVPYIEFSEIWNSFLNYKIKYDKEIIVSDRKEFISSWEEYTLGINEVITLFQKKLKANGTVIMTFNNLDPKAWKIVLKAFRDNKFNCIEAQYQVPAVISSKAQMASNTSYIGDYYCVFKKSKKAFAINKNLYLLTKKLKKVFHSRRGIVPKNLVTRIAILMILDKNMDLNFLSQIEDAVIPIALEKNKEYYEIRKELLNKKLMDKYDLGKIVKEVAINELQSGKQSILELYKKIIEQTDELGSPSMPEIKIILADIVLFDRNYCYLQNISTKQKSLF